MCICQALLKSAIILSYKLFPHTPLPAFHTVDHGSRLKHGHQRGLGKGLRLGHDRRRSAGGALQSGCLWGGEWAWLASGKPAPGIPVSEDAPCQAQLSPKGGSLLLSEMAALGRVLGPPTQALHCSHQQALLPLQLQDGWWESF